MSEDHLSNEVSLSAEMTKNGVKAGAKSRAIASLDRLVGGIVDIGNAHIEGYAERRRAKTKGELAVMDAVVQYGVERLGASPELAERAFSKHFKKVLKEQQNLEAVMQEAKVDLLEGPQDYEDTDEPMSGEFFDRFESYSSSADTDELRHRWGRVLATEIRKPGTFSAKVLRVVDEMDAETARLFEQVCQYRVGQALYKPLMEELGYLDRTALVGAGLLVDPGISDQHTVFPSGKLGNGQDVWLGGSDSLCFCIPKQALAEAAFNKLLTKNNDQVGVQVYILTTPGMAISSILPDNSDDLVKEIASRLAPHVEDRRVALFRRSPDGKLSLYGHAEPPPQV